LVSLSLAPAIMADDELFGVKNSFALGLYQQAITEALSTSTSSDASRTACDFIRFNAYIAQGQSRLVMDEVGRDSPLALQGVKLLATYKGGNRETKDMALLQLKEWLSEGSAANDTLLVQSAAAIYLAEGDYKEVLKYTHQSQVLETMYMVVHTYIAMNRIDLARKQCALMSTQDDDATVTQLASAWVALYEGGDKRQEALNTFQDLGEKYNMSLMLTNAVALCHLHMGQFEEAERLLQEGLTKNATDVDTLANMVVCMNHMSKPADQIMRYTNQLRAVSPDHAWVVRYSELEASFERCATQFSTAAAS